MNHSEDEFYKVLMLTTVIFSVIIILIILGVKLDDFLEAKGLLEWL